MNGQILIVEEGKSESSILSKVLGDEYGILHVSSETEAVDIIKEKSSNISAIILDVQSPKMNVKSFLEILSKNERYGNIPVLLCIEKHDDVMENEYLMSGAWDVISKPYNPILLKKRLHNIIARSQSHLLHRIEVLAERDSLTGLYNRKYFMTSTAKMLRDNPLETFVLIRMDVDQFRLYNSSFGSKAGDILLKRIAQGIEKTIEHIPKDKKTYGRFASDVFCICVPYRQEKLEIVLRQVENEIQSFCSTYRLKISFGLYIIVDREEEMEKMYTNVAEASRECKKNINKIYEYYNTDIGERAKKEQLLTNEMERSLAEKQFHVYLQPKYSMETNRPCGAEALVRWMHPEWGMVSPGDFIPVFEKNGLIVQLDSYMWENVCILLKKWIDNGTTIYPVSVNISRVSMYNPKITEEIVALTEKYHIPRYLLNLEITESAYMSNPDLMNETIRRLRSAGFVILMDDFGSGYSSLNTLKDIDVDILKIDMKFLPTGHNNVKSEKILASVIRMAGWLGMPVIVEGVETKEQRDFLVSIGCGYVQGFYYARPMPVENYERLIKEQETETEDIVESSEDLLNGFDAIWYSDSRTGALLKSVSVPFAILEYANSEIDILRMNETYTSEFGHQALARCLFHNEFYKLITAVEETVISKESNDCECLFIMPNGASRWYQIRLNYIGTVGKTSLVSATFTDVSSERMLEKELNTVFGALSDRPQNRGSLLVIDDLELSRAVLRSIFEDEYEIISASDGKEGLELLKKNKDKVAAILLDMVMPNMDGREFLSHKNKMPDAANIPVIVISAESNEKTQLNMLKNGVNDYVTKPFVPALVKRRLKNVIEYSSRFRNLIQEYQQINTVKTPAKLNLDLTGYTIDQVRYMIQFMSEIFDIVRLVDPKQTTVVTIQPNGTIKRDPYSCFSIWGKTVRCENCSSMCALNGQCALNKFELLDQDVFYVVSQPVKIYTSDNCAESLVLEVASCISEKEQASETKKEDFYKMLKDSQSTVYTDPLTGAYNRRFLDEMIFLHHGQNGIAKKVAVIMLDLDKFRQINDLFGHQTGDRVLKGVVAVLKRQNRQNDSVIRYGADEFVITLTNCGEDQINMFIGRFANAISKIKYGPEGSLSVEAAFGYAYTEEFEPDGPMLRQMLRKANKMLYDYKKSIKNNSGEE